ncbi:MAG TPA: class I SAM-dependent methyltransferase, partial [Bordetella sp.]|nr:class I SAM-dependent methyltransferase [Bordetella sp.]
MNSCTTAATKFDASRADEYAEQSRIALAGYDACHDLAACMLAASLGTGGAARILVAGAGGTGQEIIAAARLEPGWTYTAIDPSAPMLQLAMANITAAGLQARTQTVAGTVEDLPMGPEYDAATLIGVLHHIPDDGDKRALLES